MRMIDQSSSLWDICDWGVKALKQLEIQLSDFRKTDPGTNAGRIALIGSWVTLVLRESSKIEDAFHKYPVGERDSVGDWVSFEFIRKLVVNQIVSIAAEWAVPLDPAVLFRSGRVLKVRWVS